MFSYEYRSSSHLLVVFEGRNGTKTLINVGLIAAVESHADGVTVTLAEMGDQYHLDMEFDAFFDRLVAARGVGGES